MSGLFEQNDGNTPSGAEAAAEQDQTNHSSDIPEEQNSSDEEIPERKDMNSDSSGDSETDSENTEETVSTVYTPTTGTTFTYPEAEEKEPSRRSPNRGLQGAMIVALLSLCLILGIVGGACGMMIALSRYGGEVEPVVGGTTEAGTVSVTNPEETVTVHKGGTVNVVPLPENGELLSVAQVYEKVEHAVVAVTTSAQMKSSYYGGFYITTGTGSGVIISESGHIVTNYHVVEGASEVKVTLADGQTYTAAYLDGDKAMDIALLKIEAGEELTVAEIGASDGLVIGQEVVAVGNPLGNLPGTVTDGIISALDRTIEIEGYSRTLIQTNAAINPGNSGGGLFDRYGRLVGVVNAKESSEGVEGLGFAIPVDSIFDSLMEIIEDGYIHGRPCLDLDVQMISSANEAFYLYRNQSTGLYIHASRYGEGVDLRVGDRIHSVNGTNVNSEGDLHDVLAAMSPGDTVSVTVGRVAVISSGLWPTYTEEFIDVTVTLIEQIPSSSVVFR